MRIVKSIDDGWGILPAFKALDSCGQRAALIGIALMALTSSTIAVGQEVAGYHSAATRPVTIQFLPAISQQAISMAPPSKALLIGNADLLKRQPPSFVVGKVVTNAAGEEIGIVSKIDGQRVIFVVGGDLGHGAYDIALNWTHFTSSGTGSDLRLLTTFSKVQLSKLPKYKG